MKIVTPFTYDYLSEPKEMVLPGDMVRPDESMSVREILDRFSRGVPVIGVSHNDFDDDPEAVLRDDYVFPDFPDFADYVYAEQRINDMKQRAKELMAARAASEASVSEAKHSGNEPPVQS